MELMSEQQFNDLSDVEKYGVYKDLAFQHYVASSFSWHNVLKMANDFGYNYLAGKLIDAETKDGKENE